MDVMIALLRGINVGGHNLIPMAGLRAACLALGFERVETYIQSGNLVLSTPRPAPEVETLIERAVLDAFGHSIDVVARSADDWARLVAANPFPEAAASDPKHLMVLPGKTSPPPGAEDALRERAVAGEQIRVAGGSAWIHYPDGSARSKLSPTLLNRLLGGPVTARNWTTSVKLQQMARAAEGRREAF